MSRAKAQTTTCVHGVIPARPLFPASLRDNHPTTEPNIPQRRSDAEKLEPKEDHPAPLRENHVVQPARPRPPARPQLPRTLLPHEPARRTRGSVDPSIPKRLPQWPDSPSRPSFAALAVHRQLLSPHVKRSDRDSLPDTELTHS